MCVCCREAVAKHDVAKHDVSAQQQQLQGWGPRWDVHFVCYATLCYREAVAKHDASGQSTGCGLGTCWGRFVCGAYGVLQLAAVTR
jgi:hypothetical protein